MAEFLIIASNNTILRRFRGSCTGVTIRTVSSAERIAVEDYFHTEHGEELRLARDISAVVLLDKPKDKGALTDAISAIEFALSIMASTGQVYVWGAGIFESGNCVYARRAPQRAEPLEPPKYGPKSKGDVVAEWVLVCLLAHEKVPERLHITMGRYVRFARSTVISDRLLDLTISLESLLESQTEVSFRFSVVLTKLLGATSNAAENLAALLSDLYSVRSKIAHGDPSAGKLVKKISDKLTELDSAAKQILMTYVFFMQNHSRAEWARHLSTRLFA